MVGCVPELPRGEVDSGKGEFALGVVQPRPTQLSIPFFKRVRR
jgi:hypothetical protein